MSGVAMQQVGPFLLRRRSGQGSAALWEGKQEGEKRQRKMTGPYYDEEEEEEMCQERI